MAQKYWEAYYEPEESGLAGSIHKLTLSRDDKCFLVISYTSRGGDMIEAADVFFSLPDSFLEECKEVMKMSSFKQIFNAWSMAENSNIGLLSDGRHRNLGRDGHCTRFMGVIPNQAFIDNCEHFSITSPSGLLLARFYQR